MLSYAHSLAEINSHALANRSCPDNPALMLSRSPCSDSTFIQITHSPIWSARLSSLLCQLGVDFPLTPISDWVFCLSMEAGDLRLTPNLWWFPQTKARHIRIFTHKVTRVLVLMTGITSFCLHVCACRYISTHEGTLIIKIKC